MQGLRLKTLAMCLATTLPIIAHAYEPSVTALAMGGSYAGAWADGLIPVYSNDQQMLYTDLQFSGASTNAGILSAGGGYRQQITSEGILGGYLFYDRERSASESYYNVISPGMEYLTPTWQYRVNYYLPVGNKTNLTSQGWADEFGNTQFVDFSGHSEMDRMQYNYESLSYGADFTVGYRFQADNRWQVNLSPYAFNRDNANAMMGANAQLDFYTNDHTTIFIGDGYDNANHNRVFAGVSFTFGAHNNDATTSNLMNSPVYRNLDVNTTSNGLPVSEYTKFSDEQALQANNLYFVNSDAAGSAEDGTYENPYTDIDQISGASSDAQIRVEDTGTDYNSATTITLTGTQTIAGYADDYKTVATGDDRPIIQSEGLVLMGTDNSVANLQLIGFGTNNSTGINISGANATIDNVVVGSTNEHDYYETGIKASSSGALVISDATITAYTSRSADARGVELNGANNVTITDSTITSTSETFNAAAVYVGGETGEINISESTLIATSNSTDSTHRAYGLRINLSNSEANEINLTNSTLTVTNDEGIAIGVYNTSTVSGEISGNVINVTATTPSGIVDSGGELTQENNIINLSS
ncbi:MAG: hypothetical protein KBD83_02960 [Gammaproteobacteria bacterium]|nr:hypothetical protein [Gammaproteobacteria bacterium]